ncbi:YmfQ family protein [Acinetobacter pittii]|uniref:YmfQ family protein n=1 Tax=Acinetobacter pittii TaxID=48296 RepID=UPI0021CDCC58|nr:YmfQ family protein [Acinetobacter pittii]MCU4455324.1 YmfQ family protein [Acinetobacter pittii]MCU4458802.1 YmfQ family protein [Acinetobacter pittii]
MNFNQTVELYASVLRQLLPAGGYDTSPKGVVAKDVYAHAKVLAQADVDAKRILTTLECIPEELLNEYEATLGLPLKCSVNATKKIEERLQIIQWIQQTKNVLNRAYLEQVLAMFGVELINLVRFTPMQCTEPCDSPVNTESLRYKVKLILKAPVQANMACIIENYLPAYVRYDIVEEQP